MGMARGHCSLLRFDNQWHKGSHQILFVQNVSKSVNVSIYFLQAYVGGNVSAVDRWLDDRSSGGGRRAYVTPVRVVVSLLRAAGAAVFVNNPWSGIIILVAILIHDGWTFCLGNPIQYSILFGIQVVHIIT